MKSNLRAMLKTTLLTSVLIVTPAAMADTGWLDGLKSMLGFGDKKSAVLDDSKVTEGLKETLIQATKNATAKLGQAGGFSHSETQISLPDSFDGVKNALDKIGLGQYSSQLQSKLNLGAEMVMPMLTPILIDAVSNMSIDDVQSIYQGGTSAATEYFKNKMSGPIGQAVTPVIKQSLKEAGAMDIYQKALAKYNAIPLLPQVNGDLLSGVQDQVMNVVFDTIGKEEAAIRQDPGKQASALLQQLYGK